MIARVRSRSQSYRCLWAIGEILIGMSLAWVVLTLPLYAQSTPTNPAQKNPVTPDQVSEVARELWCPLCSGVRLDTCELKACEQMRQEIALKLQAGENLESIKKDFLTQYGPQVLGEPPRSGFNWLAWLLPFAVLLGGAVFLGMRGRTMWLAQPKATDVITVAPTTPTIDKEASNKNTDQAEHKSDPYARQLEEELKRYD
jgi:cytochrome c-type biogenesis protein CcmH